MAKECLPEILPGCAREFGKITEMLKNGVERDTAFANQMKEISHAIIGNGEVGLKTRIDRIEQARAIKLRIGWKVAIVTMPLVTGVIMLLLSKLF